MVSTAAQDMAYVARNTRNEQRETTKSEADVLSANQRETAQYAADMILELRNMAKSAKLFKVMVPLEYAYYEAFSAANQVSIPPGEAERIREMSRAAENNGELTQEDY